MKITINIIKHIIYIAFCALIIFLGVWGIYAAYYYFMGLDGDEPFIMAVRYVGIMGSFLGIFLAVLSIIFYVGSNVFPDSPSFR